MIKVHLDFENRSQLSVKRVGAAVYAAHPSTTILCIGYAVNDEPRVVMGRNEVFAPEESPRMKRLRELAADPDVIFMAHNAFFEQNIWKYIMVKRLGFPEIDQLRWRCTAAKAASYSLPRALDGAGKALRLETQKDMTGNRVMQKLSKPRKPSKNNPSPWWEPKFAKADFKILYHYNGNDVDAERELDNSVPDLRYSEQQFWFMDQRMNHRGIRLDMVAVNKAVYFLEEYTRRQLEEFESATEGEVRSPKQRDKFLIWLAENDCPLLNTQGITFEKTLENHKRTGNLSKRVFRALTVASNLSRTSVKKYEAMVERVSEDGRLRDYLMFYGASRTGRWSGRGVQPQNFVRPKMNAEKVVEHLLKYDYDTFSFLYDVVDALAEAIRGMIIASEGMQLFVSDFAAIESRVLAWLAGQEDLLQLFRDLDCGKRKQDNYCEMAEAFFNKPINKKDHPQERQAGKTGELGYGYGGGIGAGVTMAETYRVDLEALYPIIWPSTTPKERKRAIDAYNAYTRAVAEPVSPKAGRVADIFKQRYRAKRTKIVSFWYKLEEAAINAIERPGKKFFAGDKICFFRHGKGEMDFLYMRLPSGRCLKYHKPRLTDGPTPWGTIGKKISYLGEDSQTKQYIRQDGYGGKFGENASQAVARDLMALGFLRIEKAGYHPLLSVHDEAVSEAPTGFGSLKEYNRLLEQRPKWGRDLPLKTEGWVGLRYKKGD